MSAERHRRRWEDNIKTYIKEDLECVDYIQLLKDMAQPRVLMSMAVNLRVQ
jgi:hypothetical protein